MLNTFQALSKSNRTLFKNKTEACDKTEAFDYPLLPDGIYELKTILNCISCRSLI